MLLGKKVRYASLALLWLAVITLLMHRLVVLAGKEREFLQDQSRARVNRTVKIPKKRGRIIDKNKHVLAMSEVKTSLWVNPKELMANPHELKLVAHVLGDSPVKLRQRLQVAKDKNFMYLTRAADDAIVQRMHDSQLRSVHTLPDYARYYPGGESTAQLIGGVDIDGKGMEGVELMLDSSLSGQAGYKKVVVNRYGETIEKVNAEAPRHGKDVRLSIDKNSQHHVYKALKKGVKDAGAKAGMAVVLDVETGGVLAAVNYPSFDAGQKNITPSMRRNRVFTDLLEPGSTFKPLSMAYVLRDGAPKAQADIDTTPGIWHLQKNTVRDVRNYGVISLDDVLMRSSNIAIAKLVLASQGNFTEWLEKAFPVASKSLPSYPGEPTGRINRPAPNQLFDLASLSYGYGVSMTTLQLAHAYLSIANGGYEQPVYLVESGTKIGRGERVIPMDVVTRIKKMMKKVVSKGTGRLGQVEGVEAAGKTGTTHVYTDKGYAQDRYTASFAGFAPFSEPKYVIVVVVDEPNKTRHYGGQVAAPIFSDILFSLLYLDSKA